MPRRTINVGQGEPLFDLTSFGRPGPGGRVRQSAVQFEQIARTVSRAPEVLVKVSGGAKTPPGVLAHLRYIDRDGKLEVETDEGERLKGKGIEKDITADWELDATSAHAARPYRGKAGRKPTKLVHNVILSMPSGTDPHWLLAAGREFAREQFALQHRYALVLHTDQDHPHVHLVIKALGEDGKRLNIRKATLREWRKRFAEHLRAQGVAANATERAVRGQTRSAFKDGIYRAALRGDSWHLREREARIVRELGNGGLEPGPDKAKLLETRRAVIDGWNAVVDALLKEGHGELAQKVWEFVGGMRPPLTTDEQLAARLTERSRARERERQKELTR